jgi:hypothetical protein
VSPESVISHTLVTGGSVVCLPAPVVFGVLDGDGVEVEVGGVTMLAGVFDVVDRVAPPAWAGPDPSAPAVEDVAAGVGWGATGGGWTAVVTPA